MKKGEVFRLILAFAIVSVCVLVKLQAEHRRSHRVMGTVTVGPVEIIQTGDK